MSATLSTPVKMAMIILQVKTTIIIYLERARGRDLKTESNTKNKSK